MNELCIFFAGGISFSETLDVVEDTVLLGDWDGFFRLPQIID